MPQAFVSYLQLRSISKKILPASGMYFILHGSIQKPTHIRRLPEEHGQLTLLISKSPTGRKCVSFNLAGECGHSKVSAQSNKPCCLSSPLSQLVAHARYRQHTRYATQHCHKQGVGVHQQQSIIDYSLANVHNQTSTPLGPLSVATMYLMFATRAVSWEGSVPSTTNGHTYERKWFGPIQAHTLLSR